MQITKLWDKTAVRIAAVAAVLLALVLPAVMAAETRDCDGNAVVYCGAYSRDELINKINNGDGRNDSNNLKQVLYNEGRGLSEDAIRSGSTSDGVVTRDGRVLVGSRVVATNAWVAGREQVAASVKDGSVYFRPAGDAFSGESVPALVHVADGNFAWAVTKTGGNPVKPVQSPVGRIAAKVINVTKNTPAADANDESAAVDAAPGDVMRFDVAVTNTGSADLTGVSIKTDLPAGLELENSGDRSVSQGLGTIMPNQSRVATISTRVSGDANGMINHQICFNADGGHTACDAAVLKVAGTGPVSSQGAPAAQPAATAPVAGQPVATAAPAAGPAPTEDPLPQTGPGTVLAGIAGLGALGYAGREYVRSRRDLRDRLLGR